MESAAWVREALSLSEFTKGTGEFTKSSASSVRARGGSWSGETTTSQPAGLFQSRMHTAAPAVWPPTPDPWLLSFGSTTRSPKSGSLRLQPLLLGVALAVGATVCIAFSAAAMLAVRRYGPGQYMRLQASEENKARQEKRPEDLFFKSADLADRILAGHSEEEPGLWEELQRLRDQVASCRCSGDTDTERLALAGRALDVAGRARPSSYWWVRKPFLAHELSQLRAQCIKMGLVDKRTAISTGAPNRSATTPPSTPCSSPHGADSARS